MNTRLILLAILFAGSSLAAAVKAPVGPDQERIQKRLQLVHELLSDREVEGLTKKQQTNRAKNLETLGEYWRRGKFPKNTHHDGARVPYWIDDEGTYCAAAYLVSKSGHDGVAQRIATSQNNLFIEQMQDVGLTAWAKNSGLQLEELQLIQPTYAPPDQFYAIAARNDKNAIRSIVKAGQGTKFLVIAALSGQPDAVETAINAGVDVNAKLTGSFSRGGGRSAIPLGFYPIDYAATRADEKVISLLLKAGANVEDSDPLHALVHTSQITGGGGSTPKDFSNIIPMLIKAGAKVKKERPRGQHLYPYILHNFGCASLREFELLKSTGIVKDQDEGPQSWGAFDACARSGSREVLDHLIKTGHTLSVSPPTPRGRSPMKGAPGELLVAIDKDEIHRLRDFQKAFPSSAIRIREPDYSGKFPSGATVIGYAAYRGKPKFIKKFIAMGLTPNHHDLVWAANKTEVEFALVRNALGKSYPKNQTTLETVIKGLAQSCQVKHLQYALTRHKGKTWSQKGMVYTSRCSEAAKIFEEALSERRHPLAAGHERADSAALFPMKIEHPRRVKGRIYIGMQIGLGWKSLFRIPLAFIFFAIVFGGILWTSAMLSLLNNLAQHIPPHPPSFRVARL